MDTPVRFEGADCVLTIARPFERVVLITFVGRERGDLGQGPFRELEKDLSGDAQLDVFVDARHGMSATLDVTGDWAVWLRTHKDRIRSVNVLTHSRMLQVSMDAMRTFSGMGEKMRLFTDEAEFEAALSLFTRHAER